MEIRDLRALLEVVRTGSFTVAGERLGYTQSAVSQQIASLEAELGHRLVSRRPVRPTAAGVRLAEHASHVLLRLDAAKSELVQLRSGDDELRLALTPLADHHAVSEGLTSLQSSHPMLRVRVETMEPKQAVRAIAAAEVDAAYVDGIVAPGEPLHLADAGLMTSSFVDHEPLCAVVSAGHPIGRASGMPIHALFDAPWIHCPRLIDPNLLERFGVRRLAEPSAVYDGIDCSALLTMVAAGLGVALLPAGVGTPYGHRSPSTPTGAPGSATPEVAFVTLTDPDLTHRTELLALRSKVSARSGVVEELRHHRRLSSGLS